MKKNYILILGIFISAIILFVNAGSSDDGYKIGDTIKDFKLKNIDGRFVSLSDYDEAKGFIVVFTCNTCPYAKLYESRIIALDKKYKGQGYPVLAINPNDVNKQPGDSFDEMKKRAKEKGFTFPYLYDESQKVASDFGATRTPHIYVLSKESGNHKVKYIGAIDDNHRDASQVNKTYVEDAVDALLSGKDIETTFTKAIGCTIKWKEA